jgi:threonine/homoserine/homoserine lactone efflux protein
MTGVNNLPLFLASCVALNVMPGPDTIYIVTRSVAQGKRAGLLSSWGLCTGALLHTLAAALGLSAVLAASAQAFSLVKYAGALYLMYLGVKTFLDGSAVLDLDAAPPAPASGGRIFLQGIVVDLLNPKVALFFLAFLPQFIDQRAPGKFATFVTLGVILIMFSLVWEGFVAIGSARLAGYLTRNSSVAKRMNRIAGTLFFGLGLRLGLEKYS